jgi:hypothetical protein
MKGKIIESIVDWPSCVGMISTKFDEHIQEIAGALWNCPIWIMFQNMSERILRFYSSRFHSKSKRLTVQPFGNVVVFVNLFSRLMVNSENITDSFCATIFEK